MLSLAPLAPARAQALPTSRLDSLLTALAAHDKLMGSLTIARAGQVVYSRAFGAQQLNPVVPATPATAYPVGSVTKMFTAVLVFQLIEEKKLTLETPLAKFFPQLPNARNITIDHLLSHRSGLFGFTNDSAWAATQQRARSQAELLQLIGRGAPAFAPGTKAAYNNSGYVLLGYIVERLTGQPYAQAVQQRVLRRAGLTATYWGNSGQPGPTEARGYQISPAGWQPGTGSDLASAGGAGALVSTPTDLTRFLAALFDGRLVSAASLRQMQHLRDGYGRGLLPRSFEGHTGYGHTGNIGSFVALTSYFPTEHLAVALCTNAQNYSPSEALAGVLKLCFGQPYRLPTFAPGHFVPTAADLERYAGTYASAQIPGLHIAMRVSGNTLQTQATGQAPATLDCVGPGAFALAQGRNSLRVEFDPAKPSFVLKQGGGSFVFVKE